MLLTTFTREDFQRRLLKWYTTHRRNLPWRLPKSPNSRRKKSEKLDAYRVWISEAMLQQTQVVTVIPYFERFIERFPTVVALAEAPEQDVLRLWQGLGYYSRARNLRKAAQYIVEEFGGKLPETVDKLLKLPGVGRYTAGAISSIAFDQRAPILDGNVVRVLCRLDALPADPRTPAVRDQLWARAEEILPMKRTGDFNSALMELGATVCVPRNPACLVCPVQVFCKAFAAGLVDQIPAPKKSKPTPMFKRWIFAMKHGQRWLIEQRPASGRWAGMWQFITIDPKDATAPNADALRAEIGVTTSAPQKMGTVAHALTHRRYEYKVFGCDAESQNTIERDRPRRWVTLEEIKAFPLPKPHVRVAEMLTAALRSSPTAS